MERVLTAVVQPPDSERLIVSEFLEVLAHDIRRRILELIHDRVEVSYTELLQALQISDGTLNFHLRKLSGLIEHNQKGTYILSGEGRHAIQVLNQIRTGLRQGKAYEVRALTLTKDIVLRRAGALLLDSLIFFIFTGVFLDPVLWNGFREDFLHLGMTFDPHPWLFHPEHLGMFGELIFRLVGTYAHIFFAVYIFVTTMEAFKGQTPAKYLLGIRVVKVSGNKVGLLESAIRNAGKVFLLPLDLIAGVLIHRKKGFIRFFDFYTEVTTERTVLPAT